MAEFASFREDAKEQQALNEAYEAKLNMTNRDKKQMILESYFGQPKKGDYIPGKKGTCTVWNGKKWVHRGQGACKAHGTGTEYFTDARFDEAVNNIDPEAAKVLVDAGVISADDVGFYVNSPLTVTEPVNAELLRYPNDMINDETDYMMFKFYEYVPPFGGDVERPRNNLYDPDSNKSESQVCLLYTSPSPRDRG